MITIIRLPLMSYAELLMFIKDAYKAWRKHTIPPLLLQHKKQEVTPVIIVKDPPAKSTTITVDKNGVKVDVTVKKQ